jgi:hypothetical protein
MGVGGVGASARENAGRAILWSGRPTGMIRITRIPATMTAAIFQPWPCGLNAGKRIKSKSRDQRTGKSEDSNRSGCALTD